MKRTFLFIMVCALLMLASAALTYVVVKRPFHNDFEIVEHGGKPILSMHYW